MYKGFFEDVEYVMGLFFKPFDGCCEKAEEDEEEEKKCGMSCDAAPCFKDDDVEGEESEGPGCDGPACCRDEDDEDDDGKEGPPGGGGLIGGGPLQDIMKCLFDASDVDYDYED